jgi:hypothetical protein
MTPVQQRRTGCGSRHPSDLILNFRGLEGGDEKYCSNRSADEREGEDEDESGKRVLPTSFCDRQSHIDGKPLSKRALAAELAPTNGASWDAISKRGGRGRGE